MLIVYEFSSSPDEWMVPQVVEALEARDCGVSTFGGLFQRYRPGGFGLRRVVNLLWMLGALPFVLLVRRPDLTVIRSAPPGLHLWGALWLRLLRLRGVCWLMDYHPEIEARALERRAWGRPVAALLRSWDRFALSCYEQIIVLDSAMQTLVSKRTDRPVRCFPTWPKEWPEAAKVGSPQLPKGDEPLTLLYGGHLGAGHAMASLKRLLQALSRRVKIRLLVVGSNEAGQRRFRAELNSMEMLTMHFLPRMSFADLVEFARNERVHYGLILMKEAWAGLLSPSKFSANLAASVPTLYFGSEGTNADRVCRDFGGGLSFFGETAEVPMLPYANELLDEDSYCSFLAGTQRAKEYFCSMTPGAFVDLLNLDEAIS